MKINREASERKRLLQDRSLKGDEWQESSVGTMWNHCTVGYEEANKMTERKVNPQRNSAQTYFPQLSFHCFCFRQ